MNSDTFFGDYLPLKGSVMVGNASPDSGLKPPQERSRDYFERQAQFGQRVIAIVRTIVAGRPTYIGGWKFDSQESAAGFDTEHLDWNGPMHNAPFPVFLDTWEDAQEWLREE